MIAVIRIAPFGVFYYWQKSVTGGLGRSSQNDSFIAVINFQEQSALASESYRNWQRNKNGRQITGGHTTAAIQIPWGAVDTHCIERLNWVDLGIRL